MGFRMLLFDKLYFFKKIVVFDEALFMYGEEYILGEKIYQANKN